MKLEPTKYKSAINTMCDSFTTIRVTKEKPKDSLAAVALKSFVSAENIGGALGLASTYGFSKGSKLSQALKASGELSGAAVSVNFLSESVVTGVGYSCDVFSGVTTTLSLENVSTPADNVIGQVRNVCQYTIANPIDSLEFVLKIIVHVGKLLAFAAYIEILDLYTDVVDTAKSLKKFVIGIEAGTAINKAAIMKVVNVAQVRFNMLLEGEYEAVFKATILGLHPDEKADDEVQDILFNVKESKNIYKAASKVCGLAITLFTILSPTSYAIAPLAIGKFGYSVLSKACKEVESEILSDNPTLKA